MIAGTFRSEASTSAEASASQQRANSKRDSARLNCGATRHHMFWPRSAAACSVIEEDSERVTPLLLEAGKEVIERLARPESCRCAARSHHQEFDLRPQSLVLRLVALGQWLVDFLVERV